MSGALRILLAILAVIVVLAAAAWFYLFGPNKTDAASLVPADTVFFATIPNGMSVTAGYETSDLKKLLDAPEAKPLLDLVSQRLGSRNLELLQKFAPNLSGQSFIAVTPTAGPGKFGVLLALEPKPGMGDFQAFVSDFQAEYPQIVKQGTSGSGQIGGLDYQWVQGPGASEKICVAQTHGWIVTAWSEAALADWWQRLQKKPAGPSLAENPDFKKSVDRVGKNSQAIAYVQLKSLMDTMGGFIAQKNPSFLAYLTKKYGQLGALASGTSFEHGEITDHFSVLAGPETRANTGWAGVPCAFDTLKFTSPDTRYYAASSIDFQRLWADWQEQAAMSPPANPMTGKWVDGLQGWAQAHGLDVQKNIIGALGHEISLQVEWAADDSFPDVGAFVKVDKPEDFKPTAAAILDTVRQSYATAAVVNEINSDGHNFATLKFVRPLPISPTITEDGPYFGIFLTENHAVRSFKRDLSVGLANNADFLRQIGGKRDNASALAFLDSPQLLNRAYQIALPYVPLAAMFNPRVAAALHGQNLPPDLGWLAPMGTWSYVVTPDADGFRAYSSSGLGNQGIFLGGTVGIAASVLQPFLHPATPPPAAPSQPTTLPGLKPSPAMPGSSAGAPQDSAAPSMPVTNAPPAGSPVTPPIPDASSPGAPSH